MSAQHEDMPMRTLHTDARFAEPGASPSQAAGDAFYALLIDAHRGLSDAQSELLNARLVLLLANHVGDLAVLRDALDAARHGIDVLPLPENRP